VIAEAVVAETTVEKIDAEERLLACAGSTRYWFNA
jgi:hypothetical protein